MDCVICLTAIGHGAVTAQSQCNRACATKSHYHVQCYDDMRAQCRLECAICRCKCDSAGDASHDNDAEWLTMDDEMSPARSILVGLVVMVFLPPLLLFRLLCSFGSDR